MSGIFPSVRGTGPIMGRLRHEPSMLQPREAETTTLSLRDPPPVETVNAEGRSPFVLCCEHAGRAVPERLRGLGVGAADMARHIASDVGCRGIVPPALRTARRAAGPTALQPPGGRLQPALRGTRLLPGAERRHARPGQQGDHRPGAAPALRGDPPALPPGARRTSRPAHRAGGAFDAGGHPQLHAAARRRGGAAVAPRRPLQSRRPLCSPLPRRHFAPKTRG